MLDRMVPSIRPHADALSSAFEDSPVWISLFDRAGALTTINRAGQAVLDLPLEQVLKKRLEEFWPKPDGERVQRMLEETFRKIATSCPADFVSGGGRTCSFLVHFHLLPSDGSAGDLVMGVFSDVSQQRRTEEALQRTLSNRMDTSTLLLVNTEQRFRSVVDASPHWISLCSADGRIVTINPAGEDLFGRSVASLTDRNLWELVPEDCQDGLRQAIGRVSARNRAQLELTLLRAGGQKTFLQAILNPIPEADGSVTRFVGIFTDITEAKKAEFILRQHSDDLERLVQVRTLEMKRAKEEAEAANSAKSDFLANVSHEVRTPMNSVLGFAALLKKSSLTPKQLDFVETILSSGRILLTLIDNILDLSKIEAGKMTLETEPFQLGDTLDDVVRLFLPKADEKNIQLSSDFSGVPVRYILGDQVRIRQILINLIGNAVKFTKKGSVHLQVRGDEMDEKTVRLRFAVRDTGIGIAPSNLHKLFRKFSQADASTTRKFGGTGLGLVISKQLVEQMGGTIGVTSEPGKGSEFFIEVSLPLVALKEEPRRSAEGRPDPSLGAGSFLGNVLIVEDDPESQRLIQKYLEELGCRTSSASNGREALEKLDKESFSLIFMDWQMPEMDGLEATREVRRREGGVEEKGHVPIVALTAKAMKGDRDRCLEAGMDDYIPKPVDIENIRKVLERFSGRFQRMNT